MTETTVAAQAAEPVGIKGWLILPAIGTVLSPIYLIISFSKLVPTLEKVWAARAALSTGLFVFVIVETLFNVAFILGWLGAILLLALKSPYYPKTYVALMGGMVVFLLVDMIVSAGGYNHQPGQDELISLGRTILVAAIWIPYMMLSKRVKNTFLAAG
jgi:hypothetical protein